MDIQIVNRSNNPLPEFATLDSAGMDLRAHLEASVTLQPGERRLIPTGLHIALPQGLEAQVRPRSGLAYKHGVTVLNSPGTIDADYRGDVGVVLINHSASGSALRALCLDPRRSLGRNRARGGRIWTFGPEITPTC
jgi:dUTP pyrophosphatase